jgi:hypothetical protein
LSNTVIPQPSLHTRIFSQTSPKISFQTSLNYSQLSSQQLRAYSQSSPQRISQQSSTSSIQKQQKISTQFLQLLNQQPSLQTEDQSAPVISVKYSEDYTQNLLTTPFTRIIKSACLQAFTTSSMTPAKVIVTKENPLHQKQENNEHLTIHNCKSYQIVSSSHNSPISPSSVIFSVTRAKNQLDNKSPLISTTFRLMNQELQQPIQQKPVSFNFFINIFYKCFMLYMTLYI